MEPVFAEIVRQVTPLSNWPDRSAGPGGGAGEARLVPAPTWSGCGSSRWRPTTPGRAISVRSRCARRPARLLNFGFNGWGLKFASDLDNRINRQLQALGAWDAPLETVGLILEGGSIESDGRGTILTTEECLLNDNRNPHLTREELEEELHGLFGSDRFLWLANGYLAGDDTDSHVDTLARLCPDDTIAYVSCDDPR